MICPQCKEALKENQMRCPLCGFNLDECDWVIIARVYQPDDLIVESLLRSCDIPVKLIREAIGSGQAFNFSIGPLAEVKIAVPQICASEAADLLKPQEEELP
jgi:hypothetical protein